MEKTDKMDKNDRLLNPNEVAEWLGTNVARIYAAAKAGTIPAFKFGRLWKFRLGDLLSWVAAGGNLNQTGI